MDTRYAERARLVADLVRRGEIDRPELAQVMREVARHWFLPDPAARDAYDDTPLAIGYGQTISQPAIVAHMTRALELTHRERILEIGTGSGYQAAILSRLCREVFSIERVAPLLERARTALREHGFENVHLRLGDGYAGWPEEAPFDRIILTAAPPETPHELHRQLAEGGLLVAPIGDRFDQVLIRDRKIDGVIQREQLLPVQFVPMLSGLAAS